MFFNNNVCLWLASKLGNEKRLCVFCSLNFSEKYILKPTFMQISEKLAFVAMFFSSLTQAEKGTTKHPFLQVA